MNRRLLLPAVYVSDQIAGDPEWLPHPVRLIGWAIAKGEVLLRYPDQTDDSAFFSGAALTAAVVIASYVLTRRLVAAAYGHSKPLGAVAEIALGWTCLAGRNLHDEASLVLDAVDAGDLPLARSRLARIVGRDTANLDIHEISRAVIETVGESASDGVIAPLFYMSLGGVPLAMAYKAVNTLDSMIGHADERYFYFGKTAARLDDVANLIPARLTALAIVAAACSQEADAGNAWKTWLSDGKNHKSPNAGQPESAMAGALGVRLGGGNFYDGEFIPAQPIGAEFKAPKPDHARKAIRILSSVTLLGIGAAILLGALFRSEGAR